jgi:hypothetical protein
MSRADSGGFDLGLHLSIGALRRQLQPAIATPIPNQISHVGGWGDLTFSTQIGLTELGLEPDCSLRATLSTAGTSLTWPALVWNGITLAPAGTQPFSFDLTVVARPVASGTSLSIALAADAVAVHIGPGTLEAIPGIFQWLALVGLTQGRAAQAAERARLYRDTESGLAATINGALPRSLPLGTLPSPPVRDVRITCSGDELRVLMTIGGVAGNPSAITRSPIRRSASGVPLDVAGVVVGNHCVLRDVLRPALATGLSLPASGFTASAPCLWGGNAPLPAATTVAGVRPAVTSVHGGIDSAGMLRVALHFEGRHSSGGFGFHGDVDLGFGATITGSGASRSLQLPLSTTVVKNLDIWVEWWVYAAAIVVSPLVALAIALTDAFVGGALAGGINSAISGAIPNGRLALPLPAGGIGPTSLRMSQPDAEAQSIVLLGGFITIPDFPANDVILTVG